MEKKYIDAIISEKALLSDGIYSFTIECMDIAKQAVPGQFVNVYCKDKSRMLPRPISICDADADSGTLRIVFRVAGAGTDEFSNYNIGDKIRIAGPLGNGFPTSEAAGRKVLLFGGGIGIPPMLYLAKYINKHIDASEITVVNGYRNNSLFLNEEFEAYSRVIIATEDGSVGTKGNVLDAVRAEDISADIIFACGPMPMLKAIKQYAAEKKIIAYISLEERMACGIGACLACVCKSVEKDEHTNVNNKRVCKEGPVFNAMEVNL